MHRETLEKLRRITAQCNVTVPDWLEDLVLHGPRYEQWNLPNGCPTRMELTEFLARWLKAAGVSQEQTLDWLLEYVFLSLAPFAKTGPSGIRHGTKANTRWVYNSDFFFDFNAMASQPPEPQGTGIPAYMPVIARWYELLWVEKQKARELRAAASRFIPVCLPVKQRHREKYEQGLKLAQERRAAGESLDEIAKLLNEAGYPTVTGRKWTLATIYRSLRGSKVQQQQSPPPSVVPDDRSQNTPQSLDPQWSGPCA